MTFLEAINNINERKEHMGNIIPVQRWIELNGNYTPEELRALADHIDNQFIGAKKDGSQE